MANISKEGRERRAAQAAAEGGITQESDEHIWMVRDEEAYPAPHRAHVHRSEIRNYYPGGWEVENAD